MIRRIIWMALMLCIAAIAFYLSRFWDFSLWSRDGLFGIKELRPQGGLLARWLRGTSFAPYELIIWTIGVFIALSGLQVIFDRLSNSKDKG